jgi:hypothetical protein
VTTLHFQPAASGGWLALASAPRLLVLAADTDDASIASALGALARDDGFQATIDVLTSGGLSTVPPFLLLEWSDDTLRGIVRGALELSVTGASGTDTLSGLGVSTWTERSFDGVSSATLAITGAVAAVDRSLPLASGVVLVSSLSLGTGDAVLAVPAQRAATAPPTAPITTPVDGAGEAVGSAAPAPSASATPAPSFSEATVTVTDAAEPAPSLPTEPATAGSVAGDHDGETVVRHGSEVREPAASESAASEIAGDHDGNTILSSDLAKLRAQRRKRAGAVPPPVAVPLPKMVLELSNGSREPLTQPILVGRAPSLSKVSGAAMPRLVVVGGSDQDISRNHAQFVLEGDTVVVTDLHSRNGTRIVLPGKPPQTLRAGEPTSVILGTVVDLGGGVTLTVGQD